MEKFEQLVSVKFASNLLKGSTVSIQAFNQAFAEKCMSQSQCYVWFKRFKEGRISVGEDTNPGRHSTSTNDDHVERFRVVILGNFCFTVLNFGNNKG